MDREPKNAQVVTQATSENSVIFLVDENGVICKYDSCEHMTHMSQPVDAEGDDLGGESSSVLCNKDSELAVVSHSQTTFFSFYVGWGKKGLVNHP